MLRSPKPLSPLAGLVVALAACASLVACDGTAPESAAVTQAPEESLPVAPALAPEPEPSIAPGLFVRPAGKQRFEFKPWVSEQEANRVFRSLRRLGGGEVHFAPGTYVIEQGFYVAKTPDLVISGSPGTRLEFAPEPELTPLTTAPILEGATSFEVDDATGLEVGWNYQLYAPDRDSTRVMEFTIAGLEGHRVELKAPVKYMPQIREIPAGSRLFEEINFFKVISCPGIVFEGLTMDGLNRGTVRGHTLYGGIYASGLNQQQERPTVLGLTVRGCTFRGLRGRALAAYGIGDVRVTGSSFHDIYAQAIEIDHFSSGTISGNLVDGAEVGVMLNDAFESVVEGNVFLRCEFGVRLVRIFPQDWVNLGNTIRDNRFGYCQHGVVFNDNIGPGLTGNYVIDNHFVGIPPLERVIHWRGNTVSGSTHE